MDALRLNVASPSRARHLVWLLGCCALLASSCSSYRVPRIDQTGERLFVWSEPRPFTFPDPTVPIHDAPPYGSPDPFANTTTPFAGTAPTLTAGAPMLPGGVMPGAAVPLPGMSTPLPAPGLSLSPSQVIAPIGSEVVMIATLIGEEGYPLTREKIEWMLDANGPGQLISPGTRQPWDILNCLHRYPKK